MGNPLTSQPITAMGATIASPALPEVTEATSTSQAFESIPKAPLPQRTKPNKREVWVYATALGEGRCAVRPVAARCRRVATLTPTRPH